MTSEYRCFGFDDHVLTWGEDTVGKCKDGAEETPNGEWPLDSVEPAGAAYPAHMALGACRVGGQSAVFFVGVGFGEKALKQGESPSFA